jgi:arginine transport system permease protein
MNEIFPLASAAGMTVGLAVCALIIGLVLAMFFAVWESAKWFPSPGQAPRWSPCCGLPEILVVLFIYFGSSQLLLTLSDGLRSILALRRSRCRCRLKTLTSARSCAA